MNAVFSAIGLVVVLVFSLLLILRNIWLFLNLLRILFQDLDRFRQLPSYERMLFCFWIWNTEKFLSTKVPREASVVAENAQSQKQNARLTGRAKSNERTMKTYQSILPAATRKDCRTEKCLAEVKTRLHDLFTNGFWYCKSHEGVCHPVESDHGQPNKCDSCGSVYVEWNPPIWTKLIDDSKIIHPADFRDGKEAA